MNLIYGEIIGEGYYGCSKCGRRLVGPVFYVGEESDDEGLELRTFCKCCEPEVKKHSLEEIYSKYDISPYIGYDTPNPMDKSCECYANGNWELSSKKIVPQPADVIIGNYGYRIANGVRYRYLV